ncbi:hypothetical protein LINGRAPRIM_LOCUS2115 [Linum grandiflorum]
MHAGIGVRTFRLTCWSSLMANFNDGYVPPMRDCGLRGARAEFSFLRLRGLRSILNFLRSVSPSDSIIALFSQTQSIPDLQVVPVLFQHSLKESDDVNVVESLDHILGVEIVRITSLSTDTKVALALRVLEGCCLLHRESTLLAHQHKAILLGSCNFLQSNLPSPSSPAANSSATHPQKPINLLRLPPPPKSRSISSAGIPSSVIRRITFFLPPPDYLLNSSAIHLFLLWISPLNKMNNEITTSLEAAKSIDLNNTASVSESVGFSITASGSVGLNITASESVDFSITASGSVDASTAYSESVNYNDAIVPSESIDLNATADSGYDKEEWKSIDIG